MWMRWVCSIASTGANCAAKVVSSAAYSSSSACTVVGAVRAGRSAALARASGMLALQRAPPATTVPCAGSSPRRRARSVWCMPSRNGAEKVASTSASRFIAARPEAVKAMAAAVVSARLPLASVMGNTARSAASQPPPRPIGCVGRVSNKAWPTGRWPKLLATRPWVCAATSGCSRQRELPAGAGPDAMPPPAPTGPAVPASLKDRSPMRWPPGH